MMLESLGQLGPHHLPPVELAPIHDKRAVADGVKCPFLLAGAVEVGGEALESDDVVSLDDVDDPALDVRDTVRNERRADVARLHARQAEFFELVDVSSAACPDAIAVSSKSTVGTPITHSLVFSCAA